MFTSLRIPPFRPRLSTSPRFVLPALPLLALVAMVAAGSASAESGADTPSQIPFEDYSIILHAEDSRLAQRMKEEATSENDAVRARAILSLARIGTPGVADRVIAACSDPSREVRVAAVFGLGELMDKGTRAEFGLEPTQEAIDAAVALLGSGDAELAALAAEALGKMGAPVADQIAAAMPAPDAVSDDTRLLAEKGLVALFRIADVEAALPVARAYAESDDARLVMLAAVALGRLGDVEAADDLAPLLQHPDADVRVHAIGALGRLGRLTAYEHSLDCLADPVARVRGAYLRAYRDLSDKEPREYVFDIETHFLAMISDHWPEGYTEPDAPAVSPEATSSSSHQDPAPIVSNAGFDEPEIDGATANELILVIDALGANSTSEAILPALSRLRVRHDGIGFRSLIALAQVLERRGEPDRFFSLPEGFRANHVPSMLHLVRALGQLPTKRANRMLSQLYEARDAPREVRDRLSILRPHVLESMGSTEHERLGEVLTLALQDKDYYVRAQALTLQADRVRSMHPDGGGEADLRLLATSALRTAARDGDPVARLTAYEILADVQESEPEARKALSEAIRSDRARNGQLAASRALGNGAEIDWDKLLSRAPLVIDQIGMGHELRKTKLERLYQREAGDCWAIVEVRDRGTFAVELFGADAPMTVGTFVDLAGQGFWNGLSFHRVVPGFVIQGGDPRQDQQGGIPGRELPCEINRREYRRGALGMALAGKDTGSTQWFFALAPQPHLDGGYTVFGQAILDAADLPDGKEFAGVQGADELLDHVAPYDVIESIRIVDRSAPMADAAETE